MIWFILALFIVFLLATPKGIRFDAFAAYLKVSLVLAIVICIIAVIVLAVRYVQLYH